MKRTFFSLGMLALSIYRFDTQDNLVKSLEQCNWEQNLDLDNFTPLQEVGLFRDGQYTFWVKLKNPAKSIRINKFPHRYKVKKISPYHFAVRSVKLQDYFDGTDIIEIIVKR